MKIYEAMKKVCISLNMITNNLADNRPLVKLQEVPIFAYASLLNTGMEFGYEESELSINMAVNAGEPNDPIFIILMDSVNWPVTVDTIITPSLDKAFVISVSSSIFIDMDANDAVDIIYTIFSELASFDTELVYSPDQDTYNLSMSSNAPHIPTYDLTMLYAMVTVMNITMQTIWPERSNIVHSDLRRCLKTVGYEEDSLCKKIEYLCKKEDVLQAGISSGYYAEAIKR